MRRRCRLPNRKVARPVNTSVTPIYPALLCHHKLSRSRLLGRKAKSANSIARQRNRPGRAPEEFQPTLRLRFRQKPTTAAHAKSKTKPEAATSEKSNSGFRNDHKDSPVSAMRRETIARISGRARNGKMEPRSSHG